MIMKSLLRPRRSISTASITGWSTAVRVPTTVAPTSYAGASSVQHFMLRKSFYSTKGSQTKDKVGFVGIGMMGYPMSSHLIQKYAPKELFLFDTSLEATKKFVAEYSKHGKVTVCSSPADIAAQSDVVITMLPSPQIVHNVYLGKNGFIEKAKPGQLFFDSSTVDPDTSKKLAAQMATKGANAFDAPVSGGVVGAHGGTLTFMVGAPTEELFNQAKPVLSSMGKNIVPCGAVGNGQIAKICNNFMLGISMLGVSETLNLGRRLGMDPKLLRDIMNTSTGRCWVSEVYPPVPNLVPGVPSTNNFAGGFGISLMQKDMNLSMEAAQKSGSTVLLGAVANQVYKHVMNIPGFEKKDFSVVYKWLVEQGGGKL